MRPGSTSLAGVMSVLGLVVVSGVAAPTSAQESELQVEGVTVRVTTEGDRVRAVLEYELVGEGAEISLAGLRFDGVELLDGRSGIARASAALPITHDELGYAATVGRSQVEGGVLRLEYWVQLRRSAGALDVVVPLLVPSGTAASSRRDFFRAELGLPDGYRLVESFPSHAERSDDGSQYDVVLPVIPAVLRARAVVGEGSRFGFIWWVEAGALSLVVLLTGFGWRHLQREV